MGRAPLVLVMVVAWLAPIAGGVYLAWAFYEGGRLPSVVGFWRGAIAVLAFSVGSFICRLTTGLASSAAIGAIDAIGAPRRRSR